MAGLVYESDRRDIIVILVFLSSLIGAVSSESTGTEKCAAKYKDCFCEDDHCFFTVDKNMTFSVAEQYCLEQGGHLATVRSANVQRRLHGIAGERRVWIGAREHVMSTWTWLDGTSYIPSGFNQFDTSNSESTAVMLSRSRRQWTWKSSFKFGGRGFVCETGKLGENMNCTPSNNDDVEVFPWDGRCILYSLGKQYYSWYHARQACDVLNADLIKVTTEKLQTKLWSVFGVLSPDERWIGLRNNVWRWESSGQELKEWHWSDRVVGGGSRHCVVLDNRSPEFRSWEPVSCTEEHSFVCEIQGAPSQGNVVGIAVGVVVAVLLLIVVVVLVVFCKRRKRAAQASGGVQYSEIPRSGVQDKNTNQDTYAYASTVLPADCTKDTTDSNAYSYATPRVRMAPLILEDENAYAYATNNPSKHTGKAAMTDIKISDGPKKDNANSDRDEDVSRLYSKPNKAKNRNVDETQNFVELKENELYNHQ
ncbi:lymphocyte antigen 75-like isoform X2 [Lingula anatina]|uniref:Lymphocyte antigen 75-like isoform X2 n=1 Tax=Lingula anatina TaxID=7574 RepID=A0A1S3HBJ4_LINAN|nr:lymphocyte antigen 75-like isoform X2 [Lingula anatina]|eukprot:XP_013382504.1 lymphocyte antigen 75-like isoform X2 [Lingula anatina]